MHRIVLSYAEILNRFDQDGALTIDQFLSRNPANGSSVEISGIDSEPAAPVINLRVVRDVTIVGKNAALITNTGELLRESTVYSHTRASLDSSHFNSITLEPHHQMKGEFLPVCSIWSEGFWHWFMDCLPKIILAEHAGFKGTYILPAIEQSFIIESFDILGIARNRCVKWDGNVCRLENLVMPTVISGGTNLNLYPGVTYLLRDGFSTNFNWTDPNQESDTILRDDRQFRDDEL